MAEFVSPWQGFEGVLDFWPSNVLVRFVVADIESGRIDLSPTKNGHTCWPVICRQQVWPLVTVHGTSGLFA
ncbi:MAG: hypothetical protein JWP89_3106 [Schlesneria sp.]|nr:hypothetical protein [Schlesneria sp.]